MNATDRAQGLLLGAALGDALGAPFEGGPRVAEADVAVEERSSRRLTHTDDTTLTLVLARHLAARSRQGGLDEDELAGELARAWNAEPWRGYGKTAIEVFRLILEGKPWQQASRAFFDGDGSYGNGAAMRVSPVALAASGLHGTAELARRSAAVTHAHEHGQHGAACQAVAALLALADDRGTPLDVAAFLREVTRVVRSRPWHDKCDRIRELAFHDTTPEHAAHALGNDVSALGSVPVALLAFLRNPDEPTAAIRYAIRCGGDTDTIASMTGVLAGARNGASTLPEYCLQRLEARQELTALGAELACA